MLNGHAHDIPVFVYVHVVILADLSRFSYGVIGEFVGPIANINPCFGLD